MGLFPAFRALVLQQPKRFGHDLFLICLEARDIFLTDCLSPWRRTSLCFEGISMALCVSELLHLYLNKVITEQSAG